MAVQMPVNYSSGEFEIDLTRKWHFSKEEIEFHTPSRADGIDSKYESHLRRLYSSFIQELGVGLNVHQLTIATATMFCHRFYMRQSHAKNDWKTVATVCMFLACKAEETPRYLDQLIAVATKLINERDSSTPKKMTKELITMGERLLLSTLAFDMKIEHPHKALVAVLKKMDTGNKELVKMAWNFVNDWLHTSLCIQYKPHYLAAGSIFLAAKVLNVTLPRVDGNVWWSQLDIIPKRFEEVKKQMQDYLALKWKQNSAPDNGQKRVDPEPVIRNGNSGNAESCTTSDSINMQKSENIASMDNYEPTKPSMSKYTSQRQEDNDSFYKSTRGDSGSVNMRDSQIISYRDTYEPTKPSTSKYTSQRQEDNDSFYRSTRRDSGSVNMRDSQIIFSRDTCEPTKPSLSKYTSQRQEDNDSFYKSTRRDSGSVNLRDSQIIFSRDTCEPTKPSLSKYSSRQQEDTDNIYRTSTRRASGYLRKESGKANCGVDDYYEREPRNRSSYKLSGYIKVSTEGDDRKRRKRRCEELINGNLTECLGDEKGWIERVNMQNSENIASTETCEPTKSSKSKYKYSSRRQEDTDTDSIYRTTKRRASSFVRTESEKANSYVDDSYEREPRKRSPYHFSSYIKVSSEGGGRSLM